MKESMRISLIVAAAEDDAIGRDNALLWHLPNDMKHFKNTTWGMPVVMGSRTFASMGSKPLPGRFNIILTRRPPAEAPEGVWYADSAEAALRLAAGTQCREVFIAGGGDVYGQFMAMADRVYLTRVHARFPDATVHFRGFDTAAWLLASEMHFPHDDKNPFDHVFQTWQRG
ncbi:MAG: dihydrofolate reductase [Chitinophagia bacterium]|nr:dihydrofolate reductase [Chitinophagia bacterium]